MSKFFSRRKFLTLSGLSLPAVFASKGSNNLYEKVNPPMKNARKILAKTDVLVVGGGPAGRSISATHEGASAGKSMGNCVATGHAAGISASLAVKKKKQPRDLRVSEIQDLLRKDEVDLDKGGEDQPDSMAG